MQFILGHTYSGVAPGTLAVEFGELPVEFGEHSGYKAVMQQPRQGLVTVIHLHVLRLCPRSLCITTKPHHGCCISYI